MQDAAVAIGIILVILALVGGFIALLGLPRALRRVRTLEHDVDDLRTRLREIRLEHGPLVKAPTHPAPKPVAQTAEPAQQPAVPSPPPPPLPKPRAKELVESLGEEPAEPVLTGYSTGEPRPRDNGMEFLIGTRLMAWIGAVVLLIGIAYFVKHAIDNAWIGPLGRTVVGAVFATGLLVAAHVKRIKNLGPFSEVLAGAGIAIYYVCVFFAFGRYELLGQTAAFSAAAVTTLLAIGIATGNNWPSTCIVALIGGFLSPVLLSTGEARPHVLFPYLAILGGLAIGCAMVRNWRGVSQTAFAGTVAIAAGWYLEHYDPTLVWIATGYLSLFYVMFLVLPLLHGWIHKREASIAAIALLCSNAFAALGAYYLLLRESHREALVLLVLGQATLVFFGAWLWHARLAGDRRTTLTLLVQGLVLLFVAVPIQFEFHLVPIAWATQAVLLAWIANRFSSRVARGFSAVGLLLSSGALVYYLPLHAGDFTPVFNKPFATWAWTIFATIAAANLWARAEQNTRRLTGFAWWLGSILTAALLHTETRSYWQMHAGDLGEMAQTYNSQSLVVLWALLPVALCALARWRKRLTPTYVAIALLGFGGLAFVTSLDYYYTMPVWMFANTGFASRVVFVAAAALCGWHLAGIECTKRIAGVVFVGAAGLLLWNAHNDIWRFWEARTATDSLALLHRQSTIVGLWAVIIVAVGVARRRWPARIPQMATNIAIALGSLVFLWSTTHYPDGRFMLALNSKFAARLAFAVAVWTAARLERRTPVELGSRVAHPAYEVVANVALAGLVALEFMTWSRHAGGELPFLGAITPALGQGCISAAWSLQAVTVIVLGLMRDLKYRRVIGVALFSVVVAKVFLVDTREMEPVYRILSFVATGVLLLAGSYFYNQLGRKLRPEH